MSNTQQMFRDGQAHGQGQEKASEAVQSVKDTANAACDKLSSNSQSARENKDEAAGFLQQTGEQVKDMAQGAADAVKNAVGLGGSDSTRS